MHDVHYTILRPPVRPHHKAASRSFTTNKKADPVGIGFLKNKKYFSHHGFKII